MWKFLRSKSIWVALSGMMLAAGTLFTAVDEAKADCSRTYSMYHQTKTGVAGAKWGTVVQINDGAHMNGYDLAIQASKNFGNVEIWFLGRDAGDTDYTYYGLTSGASPFWTGNFYSGKLVEGAIWFFNFFQHDKWTIVVDPIINGQLDQYVTGAVEFNWYPKNTIWMNANTVYSQYVLPCN